MQVFSPTFTHFFVEFCRDRRLRAFSKILARSLFSFPCLSQILSSTPEVWDGWNGVGFCNQCTFSWLLIFAYRISTHHEHFKMLLCQKMNVMTMFVWLCGLLSVSVATPRPNPVRLQCTAEMRVEPTAVQCLGNPLGDPTTIRASWDIPGNQCQCTSSCTAHHCAPQIAS